MTVSEPLPGAADSSFPPALLLRQNCLAGETVTTEQFVAMALREAGVRESRVMCYAEKKLIIEDYDVLNAQKPIERRSAARILHKILLTELGEGDEADWSAAEKLKDLYSCHTCVIHIAQIYAKGIMAEQGDSLFEPEGPVTRAEAEAAAARMVNKKERLNVERFRGASRSITPGEAFEMLKRGGARLVDVRSREEYDRRHLPNAENMPLEELKKNPHMPGDKNFALILYCQKGYKSRMAADILTEAGFRKIYTIPGMEQYILHTD